MASEKNPVATEKNWLKPESLGGFLRDVLIAAVVFGAALWFYRGSVEEGKKVRALGREAREFVLMDDPKSLIEAEKRFGEMLSLDGSNDYAIASMAELEATRLMSYGMASSEKPLHEWAAKAEKTNSAINERFGAIMLDMVASGKYDEAIKFGDELTKKAASSHILNAMGLAHFMKGALPTAKVAMKRAADSDWRNPRFACDLAEVYFADGDYGNAMGFYAKGIESNSDHSRSVIGRARAQVARGYRLEDASVTLSEQMALPVEQLGPKVRAQALTGAGEFYLLAGKADEAYKKAEEALALMPNYEWAHFLKGRVLAIAKKDGAVESIEKAISLARHIPEFYFAGSKLLAQTGHAEKGLSILKSAATVFKPDDRYFLALGEQLRAMGKVDESLDAYNKAIDANDFNAMAHFMKGSILIDAKKDLPGGQAEFEKALIAQELFPEVHAKQGELLFADKKYVEGVQAYATALTQMKQLQRTEQAAAVREAVNTMILNDAKDKGMAADWMKETAAFIR